MNDLHSSYDKPSEQLGVPHAALIGNYRVVRSLGAGGIGEVFLCEQDLEGESRLVAIKRFHSRSSQFQSLFQNEVRALVKMRHSGVAAVTDSGVTEDGHPYLVMEYCEGPNLREYCGHQKVDLSGRLELLVQICSAVSHAHEKGIVHRDLKPENVIVSEEGGVPRVRVLDFGLSSMQAIDGVAGHSASSCGTPEYMAPEQAAGAGGETRADVYSIGVILCELITGQTLHPTMVVRHLAGDSWEKLADHLRSVIPPLPSSRFEADAELCHVMAGHLSLSPARLLKVCSRDLDWVVKQATASDPEARYGSPKEVAADCLRFLAHEPLVAVPPRAGYRLRKALRRYRIEFAGVASVVVASLVFGGVALKQKMRADEALAEQLVVNADLLAQQTEWRKCLEQLSAARASGLIGEDQILLREADAHLALSDVDSAVMCLDRYEKLPLRPHNGRAVLFRGRIAVSKGVPRVEVKELVARARSLGLEGAEEAFANGILAAEPTAAGEFFDSAVRLAPQWREAHDFRISSWFASGQRERTQKSIEAMMLLYPDDPSVHSAQAALAALDNDRTKCEEAIARIGNDDPLAKVLKRFVNVFLLMHEVPLKAMIGGEVDLKTNALMLNLLFRGVREVKGLVQAAGSAQSIPLTSDLGGMRDTVNAFVTMCMAYDENAIGMAMKTVTSQLPQEALESMTIEEARKRMVAISAIHGDALADYVLGVDLLENAFRGTPKSRDELVELLHKCVDQFGRGVGGYSLFAPAPRLCRFSAFLSLGILVDKKVAFPKEHEHQVATALRWITAALPETCILTERSQHASIALGLGKPELALEVLRRARDEGHVQSSLQLLECEAFLALKAYSAVLMRLEGLPEDHRARLERAAKEGLGNR